MMRRLLLFILIAWSLPAAAAGEGQLKVGSFNLCTGVSRRNFVEKGKKGYFADPQRYWCNSATAVADMVAELDCDVLGVQEVCDSIWGVKGDNSLRPMVAERGLRYNWILYPNTKKGISYDVAIAYKPEVLDTLATGIFYTGGHPDKPKTRKGEPEHVCKPCVWAHFVHKATGRDFYFMDTHTVVPQKYQNDKWPRNRGNVLNLQEIARCGEALVPADVPSILVGDLNISHTSNEWFNIADARWEDVYSVMAREERLDMEDRAWGTQNMKDESASGKWYPDHIMTDGFKAMDFRIDRSKFPTADGSLHYPSDHYPIVATVQFASAPNSEGWKGVSSPDGSISIELKDGKTGAMYRVLCDGKEVVHPSKVSMSISDGTVFGAGKPHRISREGNTLVFQYDGCSLEARAFDDGVAWRWTTGKRKPYNVTDEQAEFRFGAGTRTCFSYTHKNVDPFQDDFQNLYTHMRLPVWTPGKALLDVAMGPDDKPVLPTAHPKSPLAVVPALVEGDGVKMVIAESDVISYPGMLLKPFGSAFSARFAGYPATEEQGGKRNLQMLVTSRENYIAACDGKARSFPWRVVCIGREYKDLACNDLVTRLATPSKGDYSWVKPGKVAWEWWSSFFLEGVGFQPGVNTETYKAYIDFASKHGIGYILMDEGWAVKFADDLFKVVPEIDLQEIIRYGKQKQVGVILWAGYSAFAKDIERICRHYSAMGVKGFKIDFLERNDQPIQEFMFKTAETAAKYHLLIDFHGCPPPTGLQKRFPNVVNYEGIFGLEQMRTRALPFYDMVTFDVTAPFIRFLTGPADYTPGAFLNASRDTYAPVKKSPMSQGTRCHQLAEYVVFDGALQMLCDSPSRYEADPFCAEFIYRVPTVWDQKLVLDGKLGEYIVTARRSGDVWYVGALTDWSARDLTIDLSALGSSFSVEAWEDGPDAAVTATSWQKSIYEGNGRISIHLAPGGGWAGIVRVSE
ncbi:MAG: glycoside hydrolase family 97 catalytic domain-containing protein [Bacteroidales bacterium]|nr:glycoside hydrolase family 97 catalytic domain-containing protein [Bacteroidales bacterium]